MKNFHEGTGMCARADLESKDPEVSKAAAADSQLVLRNEIRRTSLGIGFPSSNLLKLLK